MLLYIPLIDLMFQREACLPGDLVFGISIDSVSYNSQRLCGQALEKPKKAMKACEASDARGQPDKKSHDLSVQVHDF